MKLLNSNQFDAEKIARIYGPNHNGIATIPEFLRDTTMQKILDYIKTLHLAEAPQREGQVTQQFSALYFGEPEGNDFPTESLLIQLCNEYNLLYRKLKEPAKFEIEPEINSVGVHHYQEQAEGISPHQDYARDVNLISILSITGKARFLVCRGRTKIGATVLELSAGDLLLMRAPRNPKENTHRPFHCIDQVEEERYSIILRQRKNG
ncbi:MAG: hypothetical protein AABY16_01510 [Nanoarchaeota archaeon]